MLSDKDLARFSSFVLKNVNELGCAEWLGGRKGKYGGFWLNGKTVSAHRVAWIIENGRAPTADTLVCHIRECEQNGLHTKCVAPAHLYEGTAKSNLADSLANLKNKDCFRHGECASNVVLSTDTVLAIFADKDMHITREECAVRHAVSEAEVGRIWRGLRWRRTVIASVSEPVFLRARERDGNGLYFHCPSGHTMSDSYYLQSDGSRRCRECKRISNAKRSIKR